MAPVKDGSFDPQLELLKEQDQKAWSGFVEHYAPRIYRYFQSTAPPGSDTEALCAEVLQSVFVQIAHFKGESSVDTWIYAICRNRLVDLLRKAGRWKYFVENHTPFSWSPRETPEELVLARDRIEHMHQALRHLPLKYKEILTLRYIEELPIREVAEILGLSEDLVKNRTRQAKALLRKRMEDNGIELRLQTQRQKP